MALVLSPWFGQTKIVVCNPLCFTELTLMKNAHRQARARGPCAIASNGVDWVETPDAHVFRMDLPGMKKDAIQIQVDGNTLYISGERRDAEAPKNPKHRVERIQSKFMRKFRLPGNANIDQTKAQIEDGVLTITVPKSEGKVPKIRTIEVSGGEASSSEVPLPSETGAEPAPPQEAASTSSQQTMPPQA